jgi:hypothetical protein
LPRRETDPHGPDCASAVTAPAQVFSPDVREFFGILEKHRVEFVVVGGEAVIFHGHARFTGDVDIFYRPSVPNTCALFEALVEFWSGNIPGLGSADELLEPGMVIQFGRPPHRLDLMGTIDGVSFDDAWESRVEVRIPAGPTLAFIGLEPLLANKKAAARPKDLADIEALTAL